MVKVGQRYEWVDGATYEIRGIVDGYAVVRVGGDFVGNSYWNGPPVWDPSLFRMKLFKTEVFVDPRGGYKLLPPSKQKPPRVKWRAVYDSVEQMLYVIRVLRNQLGRDRPLVVRAAR